MASQLAGAQESAMETAILMEYIVKNAKFDTIHELISIIKAAGRRLVEAQPKGLPFHDFGHKVSKYLTEHTVGNIVRRILRLIREEWSAPANRQTDGEGDISPVEQISSSLDTGSTLLSHTESSQSSQYSLSSFVLHGKPHREARQFPSLSTAMEADPSKPSNAQSIRPALISAVEEVIDDLGTVFDNVASTAKDYIHSE